MTLKENGLFWRHSPQRYFHVEVSFVPFFPQKQNLSLSSCQLSIVMFKIYFVLLLFVHLALICWGTSHNSFLRFNDVRACLLVVFLNLFSKSSSFCPMSSTFNIANITIITAKTILTLNQETSFPPFSFCCCDLKYGWPQLTNLTVGQNHIIFIKSN